MTREEFLSLPAGVALSVLLDAWPSLVQALDAIPKPQIARSPKFDTALYRKGGLTWASEYDAEGLRYWQTQKGNSAIQGGQYAEKDEKIAKALGYWIEWRMAYPTAIWSGERFREPVTAKAPSAKPTVYERSQRDATPSGQSQSEAGTRQAPADDFDSDDIPFN